MTAHRYRDVALNPHGEIFRGIANLAFFLQRIMRGHTEHIMAMIFSRKKILVVRIEQQAMIDLSTRYRLQKFSCVPLI